MKLKYIIYLLLAAGLVYLIVHRISQNKASTGPEKGKEPVTKTIGVNGVVINPQQFSSGLSVTGSIQPNEQVQIRSQVAGIIQNIYFKEGAIVQKGQALLKVDDTELQAQLAQALAKERLASENERRAGLLLKKQAISQEEYDISFADLTSLQAQTKLIRAQLAKTILHAPFSGQIGLRKASVGEYLTPETLVANLVDKDPVKITFSIPEKYADQIKVNTQVVFTFSGTSKKYKAKVYALEPSIEETTRTLQLRATADNHEGVLIPGSFVNVELPLTTIKDAILIPTESVIPVQNGRKVFVVEQGKAKEVMVETSSRTEKDVLVTAGLKKGDTVLTTGVMSLRAGTPVRVILQKDTSLRKP